VFCFALTVVIIFLINKGLKRYFEHFSQDNDIARFFIKLTNVIVLLGGTSAALSAGYNTGENASRLTLIWDAAKQIEDSLTRIFITLIILGITLIILHLIARRTNK
jgi:hypothetical protein